MKLLTTLMALGILTACGTKHDSAPAAPKPTEPQPTAPHPTVDDKSLVDGKYYLSAATLEASDAAGNSVPTQPLQVSGDYFWIAKHLDGTKYEMTMTGAAKISSSNELQVEINCKGAQDVYTFDWQESGALRNIHQTESGCPQGLQASDSQQMSIERLGPSGFAYTVVSNKDGTRLVETYTFKK